MIRGSTVVGLVLLRRRRARAFAHMWRSASREAQKDRGGLVS
jgi:hypothetical protein